MRCSDKKADGQKWNMRHEFAMTIWTPCTYRAKYHIVMTQKNGRVTKMNVCGIHRNVRQRHCKNVGIDYQERLIDS